MIYKKDRAEKLAAKARNSISKYCYTECNAYCCRKGFLPLTEKEADILAGNKKEELKKKDILTKIGPGKYVLDLSGEGNGCINLRDNMCTIHKNPLRPKPCKEFPLFIWSRKRVHVSGRCAAVKANVLYPYLAEFKQMGYGIDYGKYK